MVEGEHSCHSLDARSLFTQQQIVARWQRLEDTSGEQRNYSPYLNMLPAQDTCSITGAPQRMEWYMYIVIVFLF